MDQLGVEEVFSAMAPSESEEAVNCGFDGELKMAVRDVSRAHTTLPWEAVVSRQSQILESCPCSFRRDGQTKRPSLHGLGTTRLCPSADVVGPCDVQKATALVESCVVHVVRDALLDRVSSTNVGHYRFARRPAGAAMPWRYRGKIVALEAGAASGSCVARHLTPTLPVMGI